MAAGFCGRLLAKPTACRAGCVEVAIRLVQLAGSFLKLWRALRKYWRVVYRNVSRKELCGDA